MRKKSIKPAIAMIELIFAIVVMGIALMSAPMLISIARQSTPVAIQQEAINQAVSRITMILTYPWDEQDTNDSCIPPVLHVTNGDDELKSISGNLSRRAGIPATSNTRKFNTCGNTLNASTTLGPDANDQDDIDDFIGTNSLSQIQNKGGRYLGRSSTSITTAVLFLKTNLFLPFENI